MTDPKPTIDITRTKLYRPPVTRDFVPRTQLFDRLDHHHQRPLTLVSAPAGYGKSTLVSHWLEACDCPSAWLSLDADDNDLRQFLTYLVTALQTVFPEAMQQTLALLNAPELPPVSGLLHNMVNELDRIEPSLLLVLDDYHRIHEPPIHNLLGEILLHPPRALHLVIVTRQDPPLRLSALRAQGQVTEIRTQNLRFSATETAAFLVPPLNRSVS